MVLALAKPKLVDINGQRLKRSAAPIAMIGPAAARAAKVEAKTRKQDAEMQARAKLMLACKMNIYVTAEVPVGKFTVIDPETMPDGERLICPFKAKTLVVHPDDVGRATQHFAAAQTPSKEGH